MNSKSYSLVSAAAFMLFSFTNSCGDSDGTSGGGTAGSGGSSGTGGTTSSGGTSGTGGTTSSGGTAGTTTSGGASGSGGATTSGGAAGTGGTTTAGGAAGTGGRSGSGGAAGVGGAAGASGMADSGTVPDAGRDAVVDARAPGIPVNLGTAGTYAILAKTGISTVPASVITGDLGVSPAAATYITGFSLIQDATNAFATSPQITGKVYAADYAAPTPSNLTAAVGDMQLAFADAAGRAAGVTELGAGNIGGMTLSAGVYKWGTGVMIPSDVTLTGNATDVWIFQIAQDLTMSTATKIVLTGGAVPKNVFWQVAGLVDLGTMAHCEGVVLVQTAATLRTGASINGRLLAQTAVNIDSSTVVAPSP
jgi:hypothetical protein